ncbi:hypothetical protein Q8A73_013091 [Channa argus]|nr:hypothetical protein Q8A73_013091 [Channa argus]
MLTAETTHQGYKPPIYTVLKELGAMEEKLAATIRALEETNKKLEATEKKLSTLNSTVTKVKAVDKGQPRVAFSASLQINGNIGPVNIIYPLVYRNVLSNIGGHYSPHTGDEVFWVGLVIMEDDKHGGLLLVVDQTIVAVSRISASRV